MTDHADITHLELFAGIGGFRQALEHMAKDFNISQRTVGYSEIDYKAVATYKSAFKTDGEVEIGDIVSFNEDESNMGRLPSFNLLSAGFPCQPFSMMGHQKGFDDERGTMFFQAENIIKAKRPDYILLENVRNIKTHNKGATLDRIVRELHGCGYQTVLYDVFDTSRFGLPQIRNRLYIFASLKKLDGFTFNEDVVSESFMKIRGKVSLNCFESSHDILDRQADKKYFLSDRMKATILCDGTGNFKSHSEINQMIARPLTATMTKMHRACQDNYYSEGFIQSDNPTEYLKTEFTKEELAKQPIRRLTPKEAFLLQGFDDEYCNSIFQNRLADSHYYHQAGNAVSVNTAYAILHYLFVENGLRRFK